MSGMQELLPSLQVEFNRLKAGIAKAYAAHGFQMIETPMIERTEVLLAKAGGDTEKQIYKVAKTAETMDTADQALRFDHTVPLARYTVEHMNDLTFPFKVTQIARNFRGERAQKGRFREFYQCDVDVIGWNDLPVEYDAEVIATLADALKTLPLPEFVIRVSNRKLLSGLLAELNLEQLASEIFDIVDHAEKVPPEKTVSALEDLGVGAETVVKITTFIGIHGGREEVVTKLRSLGFGNEIFNAGINEIERVLRATEEMAPGVKIEADMLIVRGLDYYTGTVFETIVPDYREIGSICSGGRYENLARYYTDQKLPGVGGSIGLTRLFWILQNYGFVKASDSKPIEVCVVPITTNELGAAAKLAESLRREGKTVDVVLTEKKLGDKLKYAAKVAQFAIVVGEEEAKSGEYQMKNLETGEMISIVAS